MDFETEEQQLEALKKWWSENATMIIGGIVVGVSSIFGWQYYQEQSHLHAEKASVIYEQVLRSTQSSDESADVQTKVNNLIAEYSDTPYASLSALVLAKQQAAAGDYAKAQQQLDWVVNNAQQEELKFLAKIRLARLYLSAEQLDLALNLLNETYPDSFQSMALELKGDVLVIQGKNLEAKAAYTQAQAVSDGVNRWLQMKIDDIGESSIDSSINLTTANTAEPSA